MTYAPVSRFLSFVLRHEPEAAGVLLDAGGWADVDVLLRAGSRHGRRKRFWTNPVTNGAGRNASRIAVLADATERRTAVRRRAPRKVSTASDLARDEPILKSCGPQISQRSCGGRDW